MKIKTSKAGNSYAQTIAPNSTNNTPQIACRKHQWLFLACFTLALLFANSPFVAYGQNYDSIDLDEFPYQITNH